MRRPALFLTAALIVAALLGCEQPVQTEVVEVAAENAPPAVTLSCPAVVENGDSVAIEPTVTDSDDETHAYMWAVDGAPAGYGPVLTFSRSPKAETTYTVTVLVSDGEAEATATVEITVPAPPWQPERLHIYTFPAYVTEFDDSLIVEEWETTEADYTEMLRRVESTTDIHNRDNPDNQLQVVGGGV